MSVCNCMGCCCPHYWHCHGRYFGPYYWPYYPPVYPQSFIYGGTGGNANIGNNPNTFKNNSGGVSQ